MALTETWLQNHKDAELHIDGYKLFRADRKRLKKARGRFSGGVGCYVRLDIASTLEIMVNYSNGVVELLTLYSKVNNLYIAIIYRQPDDQAGVTDLLRESFKQLLTNSRFHFRVFQVLVQTLFFVATSISPIRPGRYALQQMLLVLLKKKCWRYYLN